MKQILKWSAITLLVVFVVIQLKRPDRGNPPIDAARTVQQHTKMTPEVAAIFERSCQDCHSNQTQWPWYSNVAPASWWLADHVSDGRRHLNLSDWTQGERRQKPKPTSRQLEEICEEVEKGGMPLKSYLRLHPSAKLSPADVKAICDWTKTELQRLTPRATIQFPVRRLEKKG